MMGCIYNVASCEGVCWLCRAATEAVKGAWSSVFGSKP